MELKDTQISIKSERHGREFFLVCDKEATLGELFDAVSVFRSYVIQEMNKETQKDSPKKEEGKSCCEEE